MIILQKNIKNIMICTYRGRLLDVSGLRVLMTNPTPLILLPTPWTLLCREKEGNMFSKPTN